MTDDNIVALVERVHALPDPNARQVALDLVQAVMDLHAAGLDRMMEIVAQSGNCGAVIDEFAADSLAGSLLLLHDLHPWDLETRVRRALERPEFRDAELISVENGVVRVRVGGAPQLRAAVEAVLGEAAPDAGEIVIEGAAGFVPLAALVAG